MKPVLTIHEFHEDFLQLPLDQYTLTFDDGLYSQYKYISELSLINTQKIFFISTGIVCDAEQSEDEIKCEQAHEKFFNTGDCSNYMTWDQIKHIHEMTDCEIGGHSHNHNPRWRHHQHTIKEIVEDTKQMMSVFDHHGIHPVSFCFPYNNESKMYEQVLRTKGFTNFYGESRIDIHDIIGG